MSFDHMYQQRPFSPRMRENTFHMTGGWLPTISALGALFQEEVNEALLGSGKFPKGHLNREPEVNKIVEALFYAFVDRLRSQNFFPQELIEALDLERLEIYNHRHQNPKEEVRINIKVDPSHIPTEFTKNNFQLRFIDFILTERVPEHIQKDMDLYKMKVGKMEDEHLIELGKYQREVDRVNMEINRLNKERINVLDKMREKVKSFELEV